MREDRWEGLQASLWLLLRCCAELASCKGEVQGPPCSPANYTMADTDPVAEQAPAPEAQAPPAPEAQPAAGEGEAQAAPAADPPAGDQQAAAAPPEAAAGGAPAVDVAAAVAQAQAVAAKLMGQQPDVSWEGAGP